MTQNTSMKGKHQSQNKIPSTKAVTDPQNILSIIDKSLKHLNQISEANFIAQDLYIELLKEKKTMKFDQIKKIYFTLTEGKAKQILFQRDKKELIEKDYQNHEGLVRLCWRSMEKLIKKITYYMINQNHLSVISKSVLKLIHLNQQFVRRFQKLKNSSMIFIVEIMEKLIQENSILEKKIYDILLNRGYVVSLDQFYKLNGYDAEHRQAYYAKKDQEATSSSSDEQPADKGQNSAKPQAKNSMKQTIRKKKGFRLDFRYSWRQKVDIEEKEDKQKFPANKTNFQIRQSFQKFIGDFLENENLNQILINYKYQDEEVDKKQKNQARVSEQGILHKRIFQSKIQSVLNQLKANNVKVSSKLLEIIDNSSNQAINTKVNYVQKKIAERKNSERRQSGLIAQRKLRQSSLINDRKIVNENFFRQLLRRNTTLQNYVNEELLKDTQKIQQEFENLAFQNAKVNSNVIQFTKKDHNQNNSSKLKKSNFSKARENDMLLFNPRGKIAVQTPSFKSIKPNFRFLETELNCKYRVESRKNIPEFKHPDSVAQKIRIMREEWQLKNEKSILEAIQNSTIDPANHVRMVEMLQILNQKKDLQIKPLTDQLNARELTERNQFSKKYKGRRLYSQMDQGLSSQLRIKNITNENLISINHMNQKDFEQKKRMKTQQSPKRFTSGNTHKKTLFQSFKENNKPYQVFDTRLRRFIRR